ncbi:RNA polymerase II-associated protein 1 [Ictalurus punctatus]|uniref:RNA polymerase II-associated protein 1 n=1 Tax=Ictalurus punctatus TaxID=7998 RepID=A0A2D0RPZ9_ICTPU|nr:RNA polymerase II-associated protein 1 [Ictalurus punctatus]XP_017332588.1 RNA polymerase II-associated protein 1 [Ictalurus punctatus]
MLQRPKPTDSESDLLQEQERFLASGSTPAASVTRRADKRRGDNASAGSDESRVNPRDVVTIADLPDELPALTPAPPKKSCPKKEHVRFENEDPEELLERHDTHISAVLSRIVERDTSAVPVLLPAFTSTAFPKVLHRSTGNKQGTSLGGRKSIFACHIAAQKAKTGGEKKNESKVSNTQASESTPAQGTADGPLLVSGQGLGPDKAEETLKIHQENEAKLQGMSQSEILEEQKLLLAQLDPRLVDFVRSRKAQNASCSMSSSIEKSVYPDQSLTESKALAPHYSDSVPDSQEFTMDTDEEDETEPTNHHPITVEQLPIKPEKEWLHMDKLEPEKLEWMRDLPAPRKQGTKQAMQARFDFSGILLPPTEDLPTHLGLHHHGEEPELAGYSLQELFLLSRSQLTQQRSLALNTLAHILSKARVGEYSSCLKGNVLASLLDAGLLFLLRFSLDDSVEGVMSAAVRALRALLVSTEDEENLDNMFPWLLGMAAFPLVPQIYKEEDEDDEGLNESTKETEKEKEERKLDYDVAQQDVMKGLLKMQLLQRLRYILEVVRPSPQTVLDILGVLIRIARHSTSAATQILDCPRLIETVMSDFLPCSWTPLTSPTPLSLYGLPVSTAVKLLRVLASAGRHACARILSNLGGKERLSRFLSVEPSELLLESGENICCSTEALRLWAVAASYGQACNLYKDMYPVLVKALQVAHKPCAPSEALLVLELQRVKALLVLLTQVTHTAGCHQELQSGLLSSQWDECLPPPPVTWSHVSGLQPTLTGILKGCVRKLDDPSQRSSTLSLLPSYLIYMGAYYSQFSVQSSFQPVQCLQELEALTTEVLLPLISNQVFHNMMGSLRSSSVICKPGLSTSDLEDVPSLPGLGSSRVKITSLLGPEFPLPLCTALFNLLDIIMTIHRGLTKSFSSLIRLDSVLVYLQSCVGATPSVSHASAWILSHEHHFLYLVLRLAHRLVPADPEVKKHASLFHQVALALLSWLLPGSEYLAHELVSTMIFNQDLFPEAGSGGPEAVTLAELRLREMSSHSPSPGPLLRDSLAQLPSIRACYLTHLAYLEPAVITSRERHLGRNPWLSSQLLPELSGPSLPSDWAFLPLVSLYERIGVSQGGGLRAESLPAGSVQSLTHCLQWLLVLESFRERALQLVPPVAKLARLVCIFLCSSDIFLERPVKELTWALLRGLTRPGHLEALDLSLSPPGLASFHDLYSTLLAQYEAVSFGDSLFGCFILLPLQRRYSVSMRLAVFGEHVSILRSLGVSLEKLPIALEKFTSPAEDSQPLLRLYFRALVTRALRRNWCPVLYAVAVAHLNAFIFSQDAVPQEVETTRRSLLRKTYYLTDEVLKNHLLLFRLPQQHSELGFSTYEQLPPIRACRLQSVIETKEGND